MKSEGIMKHLLSILCAMVCAICIFLGAKLDQAGKEIANLNSQVSALEIKAGADSDTIKFLKKSLLKRSYSKKKVICLDRFYA